MSFGDLTFKEPKSMMELFKEFENCDFSRDLDSIDSNYDLYPSPSELRISTMTATCKTLLNVNLYIIYKYIDIQNYDSNNEGVIKIEYGNENIRGTSKKNIENKKNKKKKVFYNQATIIFKILSNNVMKEVNLKIFTNGNIQMTGLKKIEDGKKVVNLFYEHTKNLSGFLNDDDTNIITAIKNPEDFKITDFQIVLINSDFSTHFKIKRDILHTLLSKRYQIFSSYEPCIYPGVNSKYYWNSVCHDNQIKGVCKCDKTCTGKGKGEGDGDCKKITISIFQSGNIIITGARSLQQIEDAYKFINEVLKDNYHEIRRETLPELDISDSEDESDKRNTMTSVNNFHYLKKSDIVLNSQYRI